MFIIYTIKVLEVFCFIDNFCKEVEHFMLVILYQKDFKIENQQQEENSPFQKAKC